MVKSRILLVLLSIILIAGLFLLPKVVVENDTSELESAPSDSASKSLDSHVKAPEQLRTSIRQLRAQVTQGSQNEKNAIFADSLANLYRQASRFDSAGWFAEEASKFFNTAESWTKAGDNYYEAYTLAVDPGRQSLMAKKTQEFYGKVLKENPNELTVKTKLAMTYISSESPMQGIFLLREVLEKDPNNEAALFNMGMLSVQSGQYDKAIERLDKLVKINPEHSQGHLLLGIALMNAGEKAKAREEFEKVKQLEKDPSVQATVDSYLKDLK